MIRERIQWIDSVSDAVRHAYAIDIPVRDLQAVVNKIGGKVISDYSVPDGRMIKDGGNSFTIYIAAEEKYFNSHWIRFIIAHELGHLFLHMYYRSDLEKWNQIPNGQSFDHTNYAQKEADANEFAAAFLMPKEEFCKVVKNLTAKHDGKKYVEIAKLSSYFKVSELAVVNRGKTLGLFQ